METSNSLTGLIVENIKVDNKEYQKLDFILICIYNSIET